MAQGPIERRMAMSGAELLPAEEFARYDDDKDW
jgi:hypothetical protein